MPRNQDMDHNHPAADLKSAFPARFGGEPVLVVRSPGRVNLIGEHTDYNMLPVLPMAIGRGFMMCVRPADGTRVRVVSLDPDYTPVEFEGRASIPPGAVGDWGNYIKTAVQAAWQLVEGNSGSCRGFDAVVQSDLPAAAGLSSSSALVVASFVAICAANGVPVDPMEAAGILARAERYVGTAGGGMDQAAILCGKSGCALKIGFAPLRIDPVPVPADRIAVYAVDSLQKAPKSESVRFEYNRRVFECNAALKLLAAKAGMKEPPANLRDLLQTLPGDGGSWRTLARDALGDAPWSMGRLCDALGGEVDALLDAKQMPPADARLWQGFEGFLLGARVTHVFEETARVERFAGALAAGDTAEVGKLVNESHASCRDLYHISTPELDRLVAAARSCGALGARVTGAGFGGSIVAVVDRRETSGFEERLWKQFFQPKIESGEWAGASSAAVIIRCEPSDGAQAFPAGS